MIESTALSNLRRTNPLRGDSTGINSCFSLSSPLPRCTIGAHALFHRSFSYKNTNPENPKLITSNMQFKSCILFVTLCVLYITANAVCQHMNDPLLINRVNSHPKALWKATSYPQFEGKTLEDLARYVKANLDVSAIPRKEPSMTAKNIAIPTSFDSESKWPACIHEIRDQQDCGGCWAFASSEVLSDRFCIATNKSVNVVLSPQYQLSCDKMDMACDGGYMEYLWDFLGKVGTTTDSCFPYVSGSRCDKSTHKCFVPQCPATCQDGSKMKRYRSDSRTLTTFDPNDLEAVQQDIMTYGPVMAGFIVYADFFYYHSGVYHHVTGKQAGGHVAKITGWGVDSKSGQPYWIAANSWGTNWGMNGFFWMLRGQNECQFESYLMSARPLLE